MFVTKPRMSYAGLIVVDVLQCNRNDTVIVLLLKARHNLPDNNRAHRVLQTRVCNENTSICSPVTYGSVTITVDQTDVLCLRKQKLIKRLHRKCKVILFNNTQKQLAWGCLLAF